MHKANSSLDLVTEHSYTAALAFRAPVYLNLVTKS
jgi:hypothetical protein